MTGMYWWWQFVCSESTQGYLHVDIQLHLLTTYQMIQWNKHACVQIFIHNNEYYNYSYIPCTRYTAKLGKFLKPLWCSDSMILRLQGQYLCPPQQNFQGCRFVLPTVSFCPLNMKHYFARPWAFVILLFSLLHGILYPKVDIALWWL